MKVRKIEIMDTTLRDGEQTSGVSFSSTEKLSLAKLFLEELNIDRIEIASARVSEGELQAAKSIISWGKEQNFLNRIEILTFIDQNISIEWMIEVGAKVQNLLTKGSLNHLTHQLKQTPEKHFSEIEENILYANKNGIKTNVYLEDWSNGMLSSKEYVFHFLDFLSTQPIKRILLPDTLGILSPSKTFGYLSEIITRYPNLHFDFHGHNDYDLSVANTMEAIKAGVQGVHLTINGMGERTGNTPLASLVAVVNDFIPEVETNINEASLYKISQLVATFTGFRIPVNKPIVGANSFTQTSGIHADGDNKNNLYFNSLLPERFGRKRKYALGKTSGKASVKKNLDELGLTLNKDDLKKVTQRVIELGDKKEQVTAQDLPYIISDVLNSTDNTKKVFVKSYVLTHSKGLKPTTTIALEIDGITYEDSANGDGQYDAFINVIRKIYKKRHITVPKLIDYAVRIPPGSTSSALCETSITWKKQDNKDFVTRGLDSDQTVSAIKATEKMLNIIEPQN